MADMSAPGLGAMIDPTMGSNDPEMQQAVRSLALSGILSGVANGLIQSGQPSRIPVSPAASLGAAVMGANQGLSTAVQAPMQYAAARAQIQAAQADAMKKQVDAAQAVRGYNFGNDLFGTGGTPSPGTPVPASTGVAPASGGMAGTPAATDGSPTAQPDPGTLSPFDTVKYYMSTGASPQTYEDAQHAAASFRYTATKMAGSPYADQLDKQANAYETYAKNFQDNLLKLREKGQGYDSSTGTISQLPGAKDVTVDTANQTAYGTAQGTAGNLIRPPLAIAPGGPAPGAPTGAPGGIQPASFSPGMAGPPMAKPAFPGAPGASGGPVMAVGQNGESVPINLGPSPSPLQQQGAAAEAAKQAAADAAKQAVAAPGIESYYDPTDISKPGILVDTVHKNGDGVHIGIGQVPNGYQKGTPPAPEIERKYAPDSFTNYVDVAKNVPHMPQGSPVVGATDYATNPQYAKYGALTGTAQADQKATNDFQATAQDKIQQAANSKAHSGMLVSALTDPNFESAGTQAATKEVRSFLYPLLSKKDQGTLTSQDIAQNVSQLEGLDVKNDENISRFAAVEAQYMRDAVSGMDKTPESLKGTALMLDIGKQKRINFLTQKADATGPVYTDQQGNQHGGMTSFEFDRKWSGQIAQQGGLFSPQELATIKTVSAAAPSQVQFPPMSSPQDYASFLSAIKPYTTPEQRSMIAAEANRRNLNGKLFSGQ